MGKREENLKRLQELGLHIDPSKTPEDDDQNQVIVTEKPTEVEADVTPADPAPEPQEPKSEVGPDGHDWDKRKRDAQAAQREMSKTRLELLEREKAIDLKMQQLDAKQAELDTLLAQMREQQPPVQNAPQITESQLESDDFDQEYPELAASIDRKVEIKAKKIALEMLKPLQEELQREREERSKRDAEESEKAYRNKAQKVLDAVFEAYPNASELADSQEMQTWLASKPSKIRSLYAEILEHTTLYEAEDAIAILDEFTKETKRPNVPTPQPREFVASVQSDAAPSRGSQVESGSNRLVPLTLEEMGMFSRLMRDARNNEERKTLRKRWELTLQPR